jgi:hypothetical protein
MWLHVPPTDPGLASPSAGGSSASISEFGWFCPIFVLWVLLSGKPTRLASSSLEWRKVPWIRHLYGTISKPSTAELTAASWISSLRGSPAKATAWPADVAAPMTPDGSGMPSGASCATPEPDGYSSRTSPDSSPPQGIHSAKSSGRWPRAGGLRNGTTYPRDPLAPRTSEIVSSCSLPTPTASDYGSSQNGINGRGGVNERPSAGTESLSSRARAGRLRRRQPTPVARDHKGTGRRGQLPTETELLADYSARSPQPDEPTGMAGLLSPSFVEWMMGFPSGWIRTDR